MTEEVRILGIDPGSRITGWGLIGMRGSDLTGLDHGVFRLPDELPLTGRLAVLHREMTALLTRIGPVEVAVEDLVVEGGAAAVAEDGVDAEADDEDEQEDACAGEDPGESIAAA